MTGIPAVRLAEMRARHEATPHGPWAIDLLGENGYPQRVTNGAATVIAECFEGPPRPPAIAPFLVAAHADLPLLLDIIEAVLEVAPSMHGDHGPIPGDCRYCEGEAAGLAKVRELIGNHLTYGTEET